MSVPIVLSAVLGTVLMPPFASVQGKAAECPGINSAMHKNGQYDFNYDSWVKKADKGNSFVFGRCVQTNNGKVMFVDWKNTHVKGFAREKWPCFHSFTWPSDDQKIVQTDLFFGARPDKIQVPYREVKAQVKAQTDPLISVVKMSIPKMAGNNEPEPKDLRRVNATFTSKVEERDGVFKYTYAWSAIADKDNPDPEKITIRWKSGSVDRAVNESRGGKVTTLQLSKEKSVFSFVDKAAPSPAIAVVEFLDVLGYEVAGTSPVAIYQPKESKK